MIKKKICLIGEFGVGKTSLVSNFITGNFSDRYLSTIGVGINQKLVHTRFGEMNLIIWDIAGEQENAPLNTIYLSGVSGYIIVCDATQGNSEEIAQKMINIVEKSEGSFPHVIVLNKADKLFNLASAVEQKISLEEMGEKVFITSAKTGNSVEEAFMTLANMLERQEEVESGTQF